MSAGRIVVGEREIERAVVVEINPLHAVAGVVIVHERRQHVLEPRAAIAGAGVVEQVIRIVRDVDEKAGDIQIGTSIVVVVAPGGRGGVLLEQQAGGLRHIGESPPVLVAIERARPIIRDEEVEVAVAIEIGDGRHDAAKLR